MRKVDTFPLWAKKNAPAYMVGNGATIDLFILLIKACISKALNAGL